MSADDQRGLVVPTLQGDPRLFPVLLKHLEGGSSKRRVLRCAYRVLGRVAMRRVTPIDDPAAEAVRQMVPGLPEPAAVMVITGMNDRRHRRYLFACSEDARAIYFVKSSGRGDECAALNHEGNVLELLGSRQLRGWRVPLLLGSICVGADSYLVTSASPALGVAMTGPDVYRRLPLVDQAGEPVALVEQPAGGLAWAGDELVSQLPAFFRRRVESALAQPVRCGLVHGDVRPPNALRAGGESWLIDWEDADLRGPVMADLVGAHLNFAHGGRAVQHKHVWRGLLQMARSAEHKEADVVLAILFLLQRGHVGAESLVMSMEEDLS